MGKINITDEELDRDILNLSLPEIDLISDDFEHYNNEDLEDLLNDDE